MEMKSNTLFFASYCPSRTIAWVALYAAECSFLSVEIHSHSNINDSDSFCKLIFVTLSESHTFDVMEHFAVAQCHRKEHNGKVDRKENRVRSYIIMKMVQIVIPVLVVRINIRIIANAS